jgi:hypothetical protein
VVVVVTGSVVVVTGAVVWVVTGRVVAGRVVAGRRVVVVALGLVVLVVATLPPEMPWKAPVAGEPGGTVVLVARLGPVVEEASEEAGAIVGAGEKPVPKASQPGPQRPPWAAMAKATVKATRANAENPALDRRPPGRRLGVGGIDRVGRRRDRLRRGSRGQDPRGGPGESGAGQGGAQLLGRERAGQQPAGVVGTQPARAAGPGDQDDQRAQVATTDLVDGGHPVLGGHVEHDHVGGLQRPALGQLAQRADAAEPVGRVQQVVEHGGQGGALGHQQHPPPMEVAGPAPPAHVPDTHLDGRLPHPNTCRHMPNGGAKPPPLSVPGAPGNQAIRPQKP